MIQKITLRHDEVEVDLDGDDYGINFWNQVSMRRYEPDTIGFIENNCDNNSDFMDIGAANGAMTLIAATKGSRVSSYEPNPKYFRIAQKNIDLNPKYSKLIILKNKAISTSRGTLDFALGQDATILSEIVFTGYNSVEKKGIEILSLSEEIDKFHTDKDRRLVIKMDIEGAEWKILGSIDTLEKLHEHQTILILAVHPGFYRPFKKRLRGLDRIRLFFWRNKNYRESVRLFDLIKNYALIKRTNLNSVVTDNQFAKLVQAGYHEFILEFQIDKSRSI